MEKMIAYHVVTDRAMKLGERIVFDEVHHSGVYRRVMEKLDIVKDIYLHRERYDLSQLEHHTKVALRELALERVRKKDFRNYPSRMNCLYVSETLAEAKQWAKLFVQCNRPTYAIVKVYIEGSVFVGNANNCFDATFDELENLALAKRYWENQKDVCSDKPIVEILVNGNIEVVEIVEEINENI